MCKQPAEFCTALGADYRTWPTNQPLPTPPGAFDTANRVTTAVHAARNKDTARVRAALSPIDQEPLQTWFIDQAQNAFHFRVRQFPPEPVLSLPKPDRDRAYPLARMEREVFERDGGRCGYCQIPVHLLKDLHKVRDCAPDLFPMGRTNRTRAGAMMLTR